MRNTTNLRLALYDASDKLNITGAENSLNHNMELIDTEVSKKMSTPTGGTAGQVLTRTQGGFAWQDVPAGSGSGAQGAVLYTEQSLDAEQQAQARENIGAADAETVNGLKDDMIRLAEFPSPVNPLTETNFSESMTSGSPEIVYNDDGITVSHGSSNSAVCFYVPTIIGHNYQLSFNTNTNLRYVKLQAVDEGQTIIDQTDNINGEYIKEFAATTSKILLVLYVSYSVPEITVGKCKLYDMDLVPQIRSEVLPETDVSLSRAGNAADAKATGDAILKFSERFNAVFVPPANRITLSHEDYVDVGTYPPSSVITLEHGFVGTGTGSNHNYGYVFDVIPNKEYYIEMRYDGKYAPRIMGNYAYPDKPQYDSADYRLTTLTKNEEGIYTGTFTCTYKQAALFVYQSYTDSTVTASDIFLKLSTDTDSIEGSLIQKSSKETYGVIRLGSGLSESDGIVSVDLRDTTNPIFYGGKDFSVFTKCLCIGDSLTMGVFNTTSDGAEMEGTVTIPKYSYPTKLEKISGVQMTNWGIGGYTSRQWYEAKATDNWSGYDAAIIALGTNDAAKGDTVEQAGTALNAIIAKLKSDNSGIKIFVCDLLPAMMYDTDKYKAINDQIKSIANGTSDCYLLDMTQYSGLARGTEFVNGHLTAIGYMREAEEIYAYCGYIMHNNASEFNRVQFIGTGY